MWKKVAQGACLGASIGAGITMMVQLFGAPPAPPLAYFANRESVEEALITDAHIQTLLKRFRVLVRERQWKPLQEHFDVVLTRVLRFYRALANLRLYARTQKPFTRLKTLTHFLGIRAIKALNKVEPLAYNHPDLADLDRLANEITQAITNILLANDS